jgi:hypothetical protein
MGADPMIMVVVRPTDGAPVRVMGPLGAEVGRVTGATVALFGEVRTDGPWRTIEPAAYEILTIDGQRPYVGTLVVDGLEVRLESDSSLRLDGAPEALRREHGAKVYVIGPVRGGVLSVLSFGVIVRKER